MLSKSFNGRILLAFVLLVLSANIASAQTTEFTYQGRLDNGGNPANGNYDFQFRLFDVATGGNALATQQRLGVAVSNGAFTVRLDFGANFNGQPRWLEIAVKPAGSSNPFTTLTPRQQITSAPYAIRSLSSTASDSLSASCVGCVQDTNINAVSGSKVTGQIPVAAVPQGSGNYIQNTTSQQSADFNIAGNGTLGGTLAANAVTSATQFNIGIDHALSIRGVNNLFAGRLAGVSNTSGSGNSFFGSSAGRFNTATSNNSFFGVSAGIANTANDNSFFGAFAGDSNTTGTRNSFFGRTAGGANQTGDDNSFFGYNAGRMNTVGGNSFFGSQAGSENTSGMFNSFFGSSAGSSNVDGESNSFFGWFAGRRSTGVSNSFFGASAGIDNTTGNGNSFFGKEAGSENTTGSGNTFIGLLAGGSSETGSRNVFVGSLSGIGTINGSDNVFIGNGAGFHNEGGNKNTIIGNDANVAPSSSLQYATAIGADAVVSSSNTIQLGRANGFDTVRVSGLLVVGGLGTAGSTDICRNSSNQIATCSSSLRYKTNIQTFTGGLDIVRRLRPITFNWKAGGSADVGFAAEEVAAVEPLLATYNGKGEVEGVKYAQITTVLVNAVREQQEQIQKQSAQIEQQQKQIQQQQQVMDGLRKLVCSQNLQAEVCQEQPK